MFKALMWLSGMFSDLALMWIEGDKVPMGSAFERGAFYCLSCSTCRSVFADDNGPFTGTFADLEAKAHESGWTGTGLKCGECSKNDDTAN